jgi:hypothetical protein
VLRWLGGPGSKREGELSEAAPMASGGAREDGKGACTREEQHEMAL